MAKSYYSSVKTNMRDITGFSNQIMNNNTGQSISVEYINSPISTTTADPANCCKYKYLILNQQCLNTVNSLFVWILKSEFFSYGLFIHFPKFSLVFNEMINNKV